MCAAGMCAHLTSFICALTTLSSPPCWALLFSSFHEPGDAVVQKMKSVLAQNGPGREGGETRNRNHSEQLLGHAADGLGSEGDPEMS